MKAQKDLFLASEGDSWLRRNAAALGACDFSKDEICRRVEALSAARPLRILEIGCSDGSRLAYLAKHGAHSVAGVDPSGDAVAQANARGVHAQQATADALPFPDAAFDIVIFGFCLYLCDDRDLFEIAAQADRVLADPGWLLILDFNARAPVYKEYKHLAGVRSRKMDYASLFLWHPAFTLASFEKYHHGTHAWTDDAEEWVSLACIRKCAVR